MTPRRPRALEIETHALSTIAGDAQLPVLSSARKFAAPSQTPSRAQAVTQWMARMAWAMMARGECYKEPVVLAA